MSDWSSIPKPAEQAETRLVEAILDDKFGINSNLPPERELAALLGVTRPTLREALQRLSRDGWLEIRQGKPTRVTNYLQEGNLSILSTLAHHPAQLPTTFVPDLLRIRIDLAPAYTREALLHHPHEVSEYLEHLQTLDDTADVYAEADVNLHCKLTTLSDNGVYPLIYNGFIELSRIVGKIYFLNDKARERSRIFYSDLLKTAQTPDSHQAEVITRQVMMDSLDYWISISNARSMNV